MTSLTINAFCQPARHLQEKTKNFNWEARIMHIYRAVDFLAAYSLQHEYGMQVLISPPPDIRKFCMKIVVELHGHEGFQKEISMMYFFI